MSRPAVAMAVVVLAAGAARLWDLGDLDGGFFRDEAIEARQSLARLRGETLPHHYWAPFARFPIWNWLGMPSLAALGPTPFAARLPAALLGTATVALAYPALRPLAGAWPAVCAAAFLGASFWHLRYSRVNTPLVLTVAQGMVLAWALFGRAGDRTVSRGALAGLVAGSGLYAYYASLHLLPVLAAGVAVRAVADPGFRARWRAFAAAAAAGALAAAALLPLRRDPFQDAAAFALPAPGAFLGSLAAHLGSLVTLVGPVDPHPGFWGTYPPGAALLTPLAAGLAGLGAWGAFAGPRRWPGALAAAWLVLALLPAAARPGDGIRTSRGVGALVPLTVFAGLGAAAALARAPRAGPPVLAACLLAHAAFTGNRYFLDFRRSALAAFWGDRVDTDVARELRKRAARDEVHLAGADPELYNVNPTLGFLLEPDLRAGRIRVRDVGNAAPRIEAVIREPYRDQPMTFLFSFPELERPGLRVLAPVDGYTLLRPGDQALAAGRLEEALAHFSGVTAAFPDFALGHARFAEALDRAGRPGRAEHERRLAARYGLR